MDDQLKNRYKTYADSMLSAVKEERWADACSVIVGGLEEAKKNNEQKLADLLPVSFRAQLTIFEDIHGRQESEEGRYRQIDEAND